MSQKTKDDDDRGFETGIVTFIDILGFREILRERNAAEIREIIQSLRQFGQGDGDAREPPRRMKEYRLHSEAFSESVSDAIIRCRTVDTQFPSGPLIHELIDLTHCMVDCVAVGIVLRAGMTIGEAHIDQGGPLFGDAIARAVELESRHAIYPRILIDHQLIAQYEQDERLWKDRERDAYEDRMLRSFIALDKDGSFYLDYLRAAGPGEFDGEIHGQFEFLRRHRDLTRAGLSHVREDVRRKYVWLANYHNDFVAELRERYDPDDPSGEFEAEIGATPRRFFDELTITRTWAQLYDALPTEKEIGEDEDYSSLT